MPHALALAVLPLLLLTPPWQWPVDAPHTIVRQFIAPESPYASGHRGIDIDAPGGTVYAPTDGVVHFAGTVVDRPVLSLEHPGGVITSYEPVVTSLAAGDHVERGDPIGTVIAGHCAAPCLHFGVRVRGEYISPLVWLGGIERAVLLPTRFVPAHLLTQRRRVRERSPTVEGHGSGQTFGPRGRALTPARAEGCCATLFGSSNQLPPVKRVTACY